MPTITMGNLIAIVGDETKAYRKAKRQFGSRTRGLESCWLRAPCVAKIK
jgi:hypothetical protein